MRRYILLLIIFTVCSRYASAQLCTGSLGDPIVNITFGNVPASLRSGITTMTYATSDCPADGQYTIRSATSQCFNNSWYTLQKDHTGDQNGQFMLINASFTPADFYVDTIRGLCSNTSFEFAAWITNMLINSACGGTGIKPNLTFRIETTSGTVLARYETGDIASQSGQWKQYGTFFKTPPGVTSVVIRLTNNAPGGCGNDLAIDDITFRPCGPQVQVTARNQSSTSVIFCNDNSTLSMDASTPGGFTGATVQWQLSVDTGKTWQDIPGAQSTSYTRPSGAPGYYQYRTLSAETANFSNVPCRVASNLITVIVKQKPVFALKSVKACTAQAFTLATVNDAAYTYQWKGPNGFISSVYNPTVVNTRYTDSGLYTVAIDMNDGCTGSDSFYVNVYEGVTVQVNPDTAICEAATAQLYASGGTQYLWTPATRLNDATIFNPLASPLVTTQYQVLVSNASGCSDSAKTNVTVWTKPIVSAGPDKIVFAGGSVQLDGSITGTTQSFYWLPVAGMTNAGTLSPTVSPTDPVTYSLYAVSGQGCAVVSDDVFVFVYKNLDIPNAFSPNGDGVNDVWRVWGLDTYAQSVTRVYSRSGQLVFEGKAGAVWDGNLKGRPVPIGTYYYVIDLRIGKEPLSGIVVVLR